MIPRPRFILLFVFLLSAAAAEEKVGPSAERFAPYFRPFRTERAALSQDGQYVAFSVHKDETLYVYLLDLDDPASMRSVAVSEDFFVAEHEDPRRSSVTNREEKVVAKIDHLQWVTPRRLVFSSNEGRVYAIDADGTNVAQLATPADIAEDTGRRTQLRAPRVVPTLDTSAGHVIINGRGREMEFFRADYTTGELDSFETVTGGYHERYFLFDQQGRLRAQYMFRARPRTYEHIPLKGRGKEFDAIIDKTTGISFRITAENFLRSRSIPIGFSYDPNILYYASNVGRDTYGLYALDLKTGRPTDFKIEHPEIDLGDADNIFFPSILVHDRHRKKLAGVRLTGIKRATWWLDEELAKIQAEFDRKFSTKMVEITEWDEARNRFLLQVTSTADPGTWYIYDRKLGRLADFAQRAPWLEDDVRHPGGGFQFTKPDGTKISGYLTLPRKPKTARAPLVIYCREGAWGRQWPSFDPRVQALATMGYAVLQVNHRGCEGFGTQFRLASHETFDRAAAEDMVAAIDWVCAKEKINPRLTAIFGLDWGGYFAVRAMQVFPDRFRCGIVVNPQADFAMLFNYSNEFDLRTQVYVSMFGKDRKRLDELSALAAAKDLTQPLLIVRNKLRSQPQLEALRSALGRAGNKPEVLDVTYEFMRGPEATAKAFEHIEGFLNMNVYRFGASSGDAKVVRDEPPPPSAPAADEAAPAPRPELPAGSETPPPQITPEAPKAPLPGF